MAEYEWTMYQIEVNYLCYHALESGLLYLFSILINLESTRVSSIKLLTQNLGGKSNFDMFYKKIIAEQSSVIQYAWPMCHMKEK